MTNRSTRNHFPRTCLIQVSQTIPGFTLSYAADPSSEEALKRPAAEIAPEQELTGGGTQAAVLIQPCHTK